MISKVSKIDINPLLNGKLTITHQRPEVADTNRDIRHGDGIIRYRN